MMGREGQQPRVKPDRRAVALEHGALQVVIQKHARHAAPGGKGTGVAGEEARHAGVQEEAQVDRPRVRQHHHEGHQRPARPSDLQVPEVRPIDLGLLAWQRAQSQVRFGRLARTQQRHAVPELTGPAPVAAFARHHEQPAGRQGGETRQRLGDQQHVRIHRRGARRRPRTGKSGLRQHAADRVVVHVQLARDRVHAPLLGEVVAQDLRFQLRRNRHAGLAWLGRVGGRGARTPVAPAASSARGTRGSARRAQRHRPGRIRSRSAAPPPRPAVDHRPPSRRNPDASRSFAAPGTGAPGPHARSGPAGSSDSAVRRHVGPRRAPGSRKHDRNRSGRGRSGGRSAPAPSSVRTGTSGQCRAWALSARSRNAPQPCRRRICNTVRRTRAVSRNACGARRRTLLRVRPSSRSVCSARRLSGPTRSRRSHRHRAGEHLSRTRLGMQPRAARPSSRRPCGPPKTKKNYNTQPIPLHRHRTPRKRPLKLRGRYPRFLAGNYTPKSAFESAATNRAR